MGLVEGVQCALIQLEGLPSPPGTADQILELKERLEERRQLKHRERYLRLRMRPWLRPSCAFPFRHPLFSQSTDERHLGPAVAIVMPMEEARKFSTSTFEP